MKAFVIIAVLLGLAYGGKYLYDNHYFDEFLSSVNRTTERTADFATDKAVRETNL